MCVCTCYWRAFLFIVVAVYALIVVQIFVSSLDLRDPVATYNLYQLEELNNSTQWEQVCSLLFSFSWNSCLNLGVSPVEVKVVETKCFNYIAIILLTHLLILIHSQRRLQLQTVMICHLQRQMLMVIER